MADNSGAPWAGVGLPPAASQRIERANASNVAGSLLGVADAAALEGVGFTAVGEVMGCLVQHLGWAGWGCNYVIGAPSQVYTSAYRSRWGGGMGPYVDALYEAWDKALGRMLAEASALGADGVVGVSIKERFLEGDNRELMLVGTAVRGRYRTRAQHPFVTDLSGTDVAKLLHAGWVPCGLAYGLSVGIRHDDYRTQNCVSIWSGNNEVPGYTDLVHTVREDARHQMSVRARRHGGEAVVVSDMSLRTWEIEPAQGHRDHCAEAQIVGTVATQYSRRLHSTTNSLTILSLKGKKEYQR